MRPRLALPPKLRPGARVAVVSPSFAAPGAFPAVHELAMRRLAGFCSGLAQTGGPPIVGYWLGRPIASIIARANILLFFGFSDSFSLVSYLAAGLVTSDSIRLGVLKSVFSDPERLRPGKTRAALTAQAAAEFAELAGRLRNRRSSY